MKVTREEIDTMAEEFKQSELSRGNPEHRDAALGYADENKEQDLAGEGMDINGYLPVDNDIIHEPDKTEGIEIVEDKDDR